MVCLRWAERQRMSWQSNTTLPSQHINKVRCWNKAVVCHTWPTTTTKNHAWFCHHAPIPVKARLITVINACHPFLRTNDLLRNTLIHQDLLNIVQILPCSPQKKSLRIHSATANRRSTTIPGPWDSWMDRGHGSCPCGAQVPAWSRRQLQSLS